MKHRIVAIVRVLTRWVLCQKAPMHVTRCGSYRKGASCFIFQSQQWTPTVNICLKYRDVCLDILNPNLMEQISDCQVIKCNP